MKGNVRLKITVIRHGKVEYHWSKRYTSKEFDRACREYDAAPVKDAAVSFPENDFQRIYISTLPRSRDTAEQLFGSRSFETTSMIDEVPLRSSRDTEIRLPLWFWNISGRVQWLLGSARQAESRSQTKNRAKAFVDKLCREGADSIIVTHGFFMRVFLREMKKAGFAADRSRIYYKPGESVTAVYNKTCLYHMI